MSSPRILVTGAGGNAAQNFVRAVRMVWPDAFVAGTDASKLHIESSNIEARFVVPRCTQDGYVDALNHIIETEGIDFVHPQPDPEVAFLAEHRDKVAGSLFLPAHEVVARCQDKMEANAAMGSAGVPIPLSERVQDGDSIAAAVDSIQVRTDKVWLRAIRGAGSRAALPVRSAAQAESWIDYWVDMKGLRASDFMMSEFLPGAEFAFQSLWHDGELITSMARERVEYLFGNLLPSGQSSSPSVAVSVHRDDVNDAGIAAVTAVDPRPHGVYCVDMKEADDGTPRVTEINAGRFFTTSNFFAAIGANMPVDYIGLGMGGATPDRPKVNAAPAGETWLRGVDREPTLVRQDAWTATKLD